VHYFPRDDGLLFDPITFDIALSCRRTSFFPFRHGLMTPTRGYFAVAAGSGRSAPAGHRLACRPSAAAPARFVSLCTVTVDLAARASVCE
jgi:hypothetical protein